MNKKALTLLEIIVSTVILALVMTGLVNVFVAGKRLLKHVQFRMAAGEMGRKFIDPLQVYVRQDTWNTNCFSTGNISNCAISTSIAPYNATYTISANPSDSDIRNVTVNISWSE